MQNYLENSEGGQVWGTNIHEHEDRTFHYYLGSESIPKETKETQKTIVCSSENQFKKVKKSNRKRKTSRKRAIQFIQSKQIKNEKESEKENFRSDEELFVSVSLWKQNTWMVSSEGKLWFKLGDMAPKLYEYQTPIPICNISCGKSHALALTSKFLFFLFEMFLGEKKEI